MPYQRLLDSIKPAALHLALCLIGAATVALLVFSFWFPYPYRKMAGGQELFFLIVAIDVVCGPVLTLVLYNKNKPKKELVLDLSLVAIIQLAALIYGVWVLYQARPLYLVHEFDRFKLISASSVDGRELENVAKNIKVGPFEPPRLVSIRDVSKKEREEVLFESVQGGRDYGERPVFYKEYSGESAYLSGSELSKFINKKENLKFSQKNGKELQRIKDMTGSEEFRYLPIVARQDWIAVMNSKGTVVGYLQGDGF